LGFNKKLLSEVMMPFFTLSTIRKRVKDLAKLIHASPNLTKVSGCPDWMGGKYVEVDDEGYHYIGSERGEVYERHSTKDIQELLYWLLKSITRKMASDYELSNRIPFVDSRRLLFDKWVELMGMIDPDFRKRLCIEIDQILKEHPYKDKKKNREN
jgi:hypothetical protein